MKIIIQTPDVRARQDLLELINEKLQKLGTHSDRIIEARVLLKVDKSETRENKVCEIRIVIPGNDLFTTKNARSFPEAVRKAVDASTRQVIDWKNLVRPFRKTGATSVSD